MEELDLKVIKKDGVREPFDPAKIRDGISKACWKRPIGSEQIDAVVTKLQNRIYTEFEKEIASPDLGELIMDELRQLDQVAYVRFASVYREFTDAQDFVQEVAPMLKDPQRPAK